MDKPSVYGGQKVKPSVEDLLQRFFPVTLQDLTIRTPMRSLIQRPLRLCVGTRTIDDLVLELLPGPIGKMTNFQTILDS